jgi:hypothetical protein
MNFIGVAPLITGSKLKSPTSLHYCNNFTNVSLNFKNITRVKSWSEAPGFPVTVKTCPPERCNLVWAVEACRIVKTKYLDHI